MMYLAALVAGYSAVVGGATDVEAIGIATQAGVAETGDLTLSPPLANRDGTHKGAAKVAPARRSLLFAVEADTVGALVHV